MYTPDVGNGAKVERVDVVVEMVLLMVVDVVGCIGSDMVDVKVNLPPAPPPTQALHAQFFTTLLYSGFPAISTCFCAKMKR